MYCIYCGAKLLDGANFCTACGKPVNDKSHAAPADKTAAAVKEAVKEKTVDLAKAGARQVLAALKDQDITAPATGGEVRCKADAAQSAFLKLLKKGLLALALLVMVSPARLFAEQPLVHHVDRSYTFGDYNLTINSAYDFEGAAVTVDGYSVNDRDRISGYVEKGPIRVRVKIAPTQSKYSGRVKISYGMDGTNRREFAFQEKIYNIPDGLDTTFEIPILPSGDEVMEVTVMFYLLGVPYDNYGHSIVSYHIANRKGAVKTEEEPSTYDTEGIDGIVDIDTEAGEDEGEHGWAVPAAVVGGLTVGGILIRKNRRKKAAAKKNSKDRKAEKKEEKKEDEDEEEEKATYEMRIKKDFGDTLVPGAPARKVYARIVRISADGGESTDEALTARISISGDGYLSVGGQSLAGGYASASVEAPEGGEIPSEAVVNFRLAGGGSAFTNRMHFKIAKPGIVFFQENLTLPACSKETWRLPFGVCGSPADAVVEPCASCLDAYDVKIEPGDTDGLYYAVITEKSKDTREPGTYEYFNLGIKVRTGTSEMADSLPLYRFHMGLKLSVPSSISCFLSTDSSTGKLDVPHTILNLAYFNWDPETNDIVTIFPVPIDFKVETEGEKNIDLLEKIGLTCKPSSTTTDSGRQIEIYPVKAVLDPPTRFNVKVTLTADCGKGRVETVSKEMLVASQPVRQNVTFDMIEADRRIGEGLLTIQKSIWDHGEYNRLFPLYKLIDVMVDGYDGAYGYDKDQVEKVKDVYGRYTRGELLGANATARRVTLADEMVMFAECFLQTSEEVENSMGFFTRMAVGVVTLGMSDVVFTGLQVVRDMKVTAEKGGGTFDVFVAGVKVVTWDCVTENLTNYGLGKLKKGAQKFAPKQYEAVTGKVAEAQKKASDYFASLIGKKTGRVLDGSKSARNTASHQADDAVEAFRKNPQMSDLDRKLDQVYKNGQAHGKAKVEDLQAAQWLAENNPTPENIKLYKKKVMEVQRDKFAMKQLNDLPEGASTRAAFNNELDTIYKDVDVEVRETLRKKGFDMDDSPFAATSSSKADLASGKKVTYDRDVTYRTKDGLDVPQNVAQEAYEKAFYKRTTGIDAPSDKVAREWAQIHDQSVVQKGSSVSYGDDLNPVIKDWDVKLSDAERTGNVMTYKSTEWFEQTDRMIRQANDLPDSGLRLDMLEQALSKRQEATRQMVKQFKYVHARDVAAQTAGATSMITPKMRMGMEISARLFSTGKDALSLVEVEKILAQHDLSLELLSLQLGQTLKKIG